MALGVNFTRIATDDGDDHVRRARPFIEAGVPGFEAYTFNLILGPAGTPPAAVEAVDAATRKLMTDKAFVEALEKIAAVPTADTTPQRTEKFIKDELAAYDEANPDAPAAPYAVNQIVHKSNNRLDEDMGENDPPLENPPLEDRDGAGAPPGGGGKGGQGGSDDEEMASNDHEDNKDEEDSKESKEEDPVSGQTGKEYVPKTEKGKEMARMLVSFCRLSKSSANTIVVYFGVSMMDKLADFHEEHW